MRTEKRFIKTPEGEKIAAVIHYPGKSPKGSVLLQHGLFSDKEGNWERRADFLAERGFKAVRFDRRGYGESDRDFHEFNLTSGVEDSVTIMDFLEGDDEEKFAIYGSSFGGLIAIHVAAIDSRVDVLGLRAPVTFTERVFADLREEVEREGVLDLDEEMQGARMELEFFQDLDEYDAEEAARRITVPTILFHGVEDEVVPIQDSKRFYDLIEVDKEFVEVRGGGHVFVLERDREVLERAAEWFSRYLG
ncbi:hypothetical protein AKJ39_04415 [candidate division MSBL1 archaeon SCGC-AAA259J03]|uniref:AB hydrolase-1 domain-containing protein n=3 Tax=candidate division MSBL1 TaxID=215777 RepID=A0A133UQH3_9EURY|nr:hypothetical protein AKJ38_03260 [candidate division MSBL1 archaeon SCGC-AAA259I14]KXA96591.1 hypothetical protein AKJ39_04415 [candidate division MSBL1 archaeon SCGC-AAA259J03]